MPPLVNRFSVRRKVRCPLSRGADSDFVFTNEIIELSLLRFVLIDKLRQQLSYLKGNQISRHQGIEGVNLLYLDSLGGLERHLSLSVRQVRRRLVGSISDPEFFRAPRPK